MSRPLCRALPALALLGALAPGFCAETVPPGQEAPPPRPDVILITVDTLRADRLSCYGYEKETTPHLDGIAAAGALFQNVWATSSWTKPSMASLFTALDPLEHGVRHGFHAADTKHREEVLAASFTTLAELLAAEGYRTFGISSNGLLSREAGFAQGFHFYEELGFTMAGRVQKALEGQSRALDAARPYFLWLHYFDPHAPYLPRDPEEIAALRKEIEEKTGKKGDDFPDAFRIYLVERAMSPEPLVREAALERMQRLYDGEVAYTDSMIGEALARIPRAEDALLLVTADHGEQFREHGQIEHGRSLFAQEIDVPLLVRFPGRIGAGLRVATPVSLADVAPSVIEMLGLPAREDLAGVSFAPLLAGAERRPVELFAEIDRSEYERIAALRSGRFKYIRNFARGWERLFDLDADPAESEDLSARSPGLLARLREAVAERYRRDEAGGGEAPLRELSEEEVEQLRALGYVDD